MAKDEMAVDLGKSIYANTLISICTVGDLSPEAAALMLNSAVRFIGVSTSGNLNINSPDLAAQLKDLIDDLVSLPTDPGHVMNIEDWRFYDFNGNGPATWDNYWKSFEWEKGFGRDVRSEIWENLREQDPGLNLEEFFKKHYSEITNDDVSMLHIVDLFTRITNHEDGSYEFYKGAALSSFNRLFYTGYTWNPKKLPGKDRNTLRNILTAHIQFEVFKESSNLSSSLNPAGYISENEYLDSRYWDSTVYGLENSQLFWDLPEDTKHKTQTAWDFNLKNAKWAVVIANAPGMTEQQRQEQYAKQIGPVHSIDEYGNIIVLDSSRLVDWYAADRHNPDYPYRVGGNAFKYAKTEPRAYAPVGE